MSWTPWQSLHDGATMSPILSSAPVDAVVVLRSSLRILHLVFLGKARIAVTLGTSLGEVELENRRVRVLHRRNVVRAVAVPATGRTAGAKFVTHAVNACGIILRLFLMATGAIWRGELAFVNQVFDAFVAINAIECGVKRLVERVGREYQRNGFPVHRARGRGIQMAVETIRVGDFIGGK